MGKVVRVSFLKLQSRVCEDAVIAFDGVIHNCCSAVVHVQKRQDHPARVPIKRRDDESTDGFASQCLWDLVHKRVRIFGELFFCETFTLFKDFFGEW